MATTKFAKEEQNLRQSRQNTFRNFNEINDLHQNWEQGASGRIIHNADADNFPIFESFRLEKFYFVKQCNDREDEAKRVYD